MIMLSSGDSIEVASGSQNTQVIPSNYHGFIVSTNDDNPDDPDDPAAAFRTQYPSGLYIKFVQAFANIGKFIRKVLNRASVPRYLCRL